MCVYDKHAVTLQNVYFDDSALCGQTYTKLRDCYVQHAPHHNQSVKWIPRIDEIVLKKEEIAKWVNNR